MKRTPEEMIDFYETIFNNDDLCYMVLGALISEEELEDNEKINNLYLKRRNSFLKISIRSISRIRS